MLLGHLGDSHVCSDDEHAVVGEERSEPMHGGLKILLVTAHIEQVDDLAGIGYDVGPDLVLLISMVY